MCACVLAPAAGTRLVKGRGKKKRKKTLKGEGGASSPLHIVARAKVAGGERNRRYGTQPRAREKERKRAEAASSKAVGRRKGAADKAAPCAVARRCSGGPPSSSLRPSAARRLEKKRKRTRRRRNEPPTPTRTVFCGPPLSLAREETRRKRFSSRTTARRRKVVRVCARGPSDILEEAKRGGRKGAKGTRRKLLGAPKSARDSCEMRALARKQVGYATAEKV